MRLLFHERYGLEFLGEAFNLANHPNVTAANSSAYFVNDILQTSSKTIGVADFAQDYIFVNGVGLRGNQVIALPRASASRRCASASDKSQR
jgi:hypothetical protein